MLTDIIAPLLILLAAAFVLTQCLIPTLLGTHWFPMFRSKRKELLEQLELAREEEEEKKIAEELKHIKEKNVSESNESNESSAI